jgi:hypothetical protein
LRHSFLRRVGGLFPGLQLLALRAHND